MVMLVIVWVGFHYGGKRAGRNHVTKTLTLGKSHLSEQLCPGAILFGPPHTEPEFSG